VQSSMKTMQMVLGRYSAMTRKSLLSISVVLLALAAACGGLQSAVPTATPKPTPTATPTIVPTPTPAPTVWNPSIDVRNGPKCLELQSIGYRALKNEHPSVVGEIQNNCPFSYSQIKVTVVYLNSLVNLQVDTDETGVGPLGRGERGSFGAQWRSRSMSSGPPAPRAVEGAWDTVVVGVQGLGESSKPVCRQGIYMEIDDKGNTALVNSSGRDAKILFISRTGYDAEGKVVASSLSRSQPPLPPVSYHVEVSKPVRWSARACGLPVD